ARHGRRREPCWSRMDAAQRRGTLHGGGGREAEHPTRRLARSAARARREAFRPRLLVRRSPSHGRYSQRARKRGGVCFTARRAVSLPVRPRFSHALGAREVGGLAAGPGAVSIRPQTVVHFALRVMG